MFIFPYILQQVSIRESYKDRSFIGIWHLPRPQCTVSRLAYSRLALMAYVNNIFELFVHRNFPLFLKLLLLLLVYCFTIAAKKPELLSDNTIYKI